MTFYVAVAASETDFAIILSCRFSSFLFLICTLCATLLHLITVQMLITLYPKYSEGRKTRRSREEKSVQSIFKKSARKKVILWMIISVWFLRRFSFNTNHNSTKVFQREKKNPGCKRKFHYGLKKAGDFGSMQFILHFLLTTVQKWFAAHRNPAKEMSSLKFSIGEISIWLFPS